MSVGEAPQLPVDAGEAIMIEMMKPKKLRFQENELCPGSCVQPEPDPVPAMRSGERWQKPLPSWSTAASCCHCPCLGCFSCSRINQFTLFLFPCMPLHNATEQRPPGSNSLPIYIVPASVTCFLVVFNPAPPSQEEPV